MTTNQPNEFGTLISQKIASESETYYHHYDALGSTAALTDSSEVVTDEYAFEAFGETAAESGATPNPYQWVAQVGYRKDEETSLYDLRRRNYDVSTGRFISEDPVRSDEESLYRYVGNRPVDVTDASGLEVFAKRKVVAEQVLEWLEQKGLHPGAIQIAEAADLWYIEIPLTDLPKLNEIRRDKELDPFFERLYGTINWPNHLLVHQNGEGKIYGSFIPMPEVGDAGVREMVRLLDELNWKKSAKKNAAILFHTQLAQIKWARMSDWDRARMTERSLGLLQAVGGAAEIFIGTAAVTTGAAETGLSGGLAAPVSVPQTVGGLALVGYGIDNFVAGGKQFLTGEWQRTLGGLVLDKVTGDPVLSELIYGVGGTAGSLKATATILRNTNAASRAGGTLLRAEEEVKDFFKAERTRPSLTKPPNSTLSHPPAGTAGTAKVTGQTLEELSGEAHRNTVLPRDITGGPHAPDTPISDVISRAHGSGNPQGRWATADAAQRAGNQVDVTKPVGKGQLIKIQPGDATVIHPVRSSYPPGMFNRNFLEVPADYAVGIPQRDGTVHVIPIDETHNMHPSFR